MNLLSNLGPIATFLWTCLTRHLDENAVQWLGENLKQIPTGSLSERLLMARFSSVPRSLGKADLSLTEVELHEAEALCPGWRPRHWTVDQAGRSLLVLTWANHHRESDQRLIEQLFAAADMGELIALYQLLPLLPAAERFLPQALDGFRSNMTAVFNAIALHNPYAYQYFDQSAWNQLILKTLFVGSSLHQIVGLDERTNPKLSQMLSDYAHERWAAGRDIDPELWRVAAPHLPLERVDDLARLLASQEPQLQQAGALACAASSLPQAQAFLAQSPHLAQQIQQGKLSWDSLLCSHTDLRF
jgi:hypothetical protein